MSRVASSAPNKALTLSWFAWATLAYNIAVVLWGAYVRATGSGAGCGNKWPVCNGELLGANAKSQTIIEFTHRASSGITLFMVAGLVFWCWHITSKGDWARYAAVLAAGFLANEALLGATLVLFGHVAQDQSAGRILFLCLHFGNTLLLLATLSLTATWLQRGGGSFALVRNPRRLVAVVGGLIAIMTIGITGAVTALGDTLFPATSLRTSFAHDFSSNSPALLRFRLVHPVVAVVAGIYIAWIIFENASRRGGLSAAGRAVVILLLAQVAIGILNVILLTPIWLQIIHLCVADVLWVVLVLVSADLVFESSVVRSNPSLVRTPAMR